MDQVMEKYLKNENGVENGIPMDNVRENETALAELDLETGGNSSENRNHTKANGGTDSNQQQSTTADLVDRKISSFEWFMVYTGPFIMPIFSCFIFYFGYKHHLAKEKGERITAIKTKNALVGLGQWAYRTATTILVFVILFVSLTKLNRFPSE